MRALVITHEFPPVRGLDVHGVYQRLRLFMGAIGKLGATVDILHLVPDTIVAAHPDAALLDRAQSEYWGHPVSITLIPHRTHTTTFYNHYISGIFHAFEQPLFFPFGGDEQASAVGAHLDRDPDIVLVQGARAMSPVLRSGRSVRNLFFDVNDLEHRARLRWILQPPFRPGKIAYAAQLPALLRAEQRAAAMSRLVFVCSEVDRAYLAKFRIARNVAVVPNAVTMPATPPRRTTEPTIAFIGVGSYGPNFEAAERLVTRIMPLVRRRLPDARLLIAGKGSDALPSARSHPAGVEYLGFVDDLADFYARSRVFCCPLVNGGGTRVKLIEAAAYAMPMVSTRIGAEGLSLVDDQEILLREDDDALADACVRLLQDDDLCLRLGTAARQKVMQLYDAEMIRDGIVELMRERMTTR
jgi:glycosyltransferase involved in cell wall biosynthesis